MAKKPLVIAFGRFQPPTGGHELLFKTVLKNASRLGADHMVFPSRSHDPKKNPISPKDKVKFLRQLFPSVNFVDDGNITSPMHALKHASNLGYKEVYFIVGKDRIADIEKMTRRYINHEDDKKALYFDKFEMISAGERDPDADDVTGMSGTKMRNAAIDGDFDSFKTGIPTKNDKLAKSIYVALRKGLGIREDSIYPSGKIALSIDEDWDRFLELEEAVEKKKEDISIVAFTRSSKTLPATLKKIEEVCKDMKIPFYAINTKYAFFANQDYSDGFITVHNYNGQNKRITLNAHKTCCIVRGGILNSKASMGLVRTFQSAGAFMVNSIEKMETCQNKFTSSLVFDIHKIPTPRTSLIADKNSIDIAFQQIGGKFPVVVKSLTGAEGIGVSIVESKESLKSVLQSLWKLKGEVLIQEYMQIDYDVRTVVIDGHIVASTKRKKTAKDDFRTNKALGNETEPYDLSPDEQAFVKKIAKAFGMYWCGVDHIVVDGKLYAIEVNGSPGSDAEPYRGYFGRYNGRDLTGKNLVRQAIEHIIDTKDEWCYPAGELGLIEFIEVDSVRYKAKMDTGNGSWNSIHAENIKKLPGNKISFTIGKKKYIKPVTDHVTIHAGNDVEERHVVEFDIKFGTKSYSKVSFSLTDRSNNTYPVLVGKHFLHQIKKSVNVSKNFTLIESVNDSFGQFISQYT